MMRKPGFFCAAVLLFLGAGPAMSQTRAPSRTAPPARPAPVAPVATQTIERVEVTGEKVQSEIAHAFVQSYVRSASSDIAEITHWKKPLCVGTLGLSSEELNAFVTQRINQIAALTGSEVAVHPCKLNVEIVFTADPQAFLDKVRLEGPELLGARRSQLAITAVMHQPIQAWYATGIEDRNGNVILNDEERSGFNAGANAASIFNAAPTMNVEGSLLRTGIQSEMAHVYIVADTAKTGELRLGPIADYVAMLALSQAQEFKECRPLPSITNIFVPGCNEASKPTAIADADIAFLRGINRMDPGASMLTQQAGIASEIEKSMVRSGSP